MTAPAGQVELLGPEGVPLRLELATVPERGAAFLVDQGILVLASAAVGIPLYALGALGAETLGALALVALFVLRYGYFAVLEGVWHGTTVGKRLLGLRVVDRAGGRVTGEAAIARNLMRELETTLPLAALLVPESLVGRSPPWLLAPAILWVFLVSFLPFLTRDRQRAGDLVGGTVVVRVPRAALFPEQGSRAPADGRISFTPKQLATYGEHELETLAIILRDEEAGRVPLADLVLVSATIARKVGYVGPEPQGAPREFLRAFYAAQRAALEQKLLFGRRKKDKFDGDGRG